MIYISHRGLISGPDKNLENNPQVVLERLSSGIDVEIDVWLIRDEFYLGHDKPIHKVNSEFLETKGLWIHCKNSMILEFLSNSNKNINYFWHNHDSYTITSQGYVWVEPGIELISNSIWVLPENNKLIKNTKKKLKGICSDYIDIYNNIKICP
jgi:hypothetical protein